MMNTVIFIKKMLDYCALPLVLASVLLAGAYSANFKSGEGVAEILFAFLLPLCAVYYSTKGFKKAMASGLCCLASSVVFSSFSGFHFSLMLSLLFAFICVKLFSSVKMVYGFAALILISLALGFALGLGYEYLFAFLKSAAVKLKGRGALFGAINNAYELFVSKSLSSLFYNTSYSISVINQNGIISGVMNVFSGRAVSQYLTGKYFVNTALTLGLFASLYKRVEGEVKLSLIAVCALAFVFGEVRLLCLFILIYNPVLYFSYLLCVFVSYLTPSLLDLRIGFKENASLFELFTYGNGFGYFISVFAVLAVLMYFVSRLVLARFDISRGRYVPKSVKLLVNALGGEDNLERLEGDILFVKNPNLIDIIKIDCDIRQNAVSLYQDEIELLKEYYYGTAQ